MFQFLFSSRLVSITFALFCGLTLLLAFTLTAELYHGQESVQRLAETTARTCAAEVLGYRDLFGGTGGIYLPVGGAILPNPALAGRPDRDLTTPDGRRYTLVTPTMLLSLVHGSDRQQNLPILASIKTFHPLGPSDTPDAWEKEALNRLRQGQPAVHAFVNLTGKTYLRCMYPVLVTPGCLKNRPGQHLEVGQLFGGLSIRLPMALFEGVRKEHRKVTFLVHGALWLLGVIGIVWAFARMQQRDRMLSRAEAEARAAKEELEKVFDAISDVITIQDAEMRLIGVNKATCTLFHAKPEELLGKYCYQVFRQQNYPCLHCPEPLALKDGRMYETEVEHENLKKRFAVSVSPVVDEKGKVVKIVHCARDMTEKYQLEQRLRQAQKMEAIGTLAGGIAHDFNNILSAIIGFAELAIRESPAGSAVEEDLRQVV